MKSYLNRSIVLAVLLLSQLSVVANAVAMMPDNSPADVQTSMPCHDAEHDAADESLPVETCCGDICDCPVMGCAAYALTLETGLLKLAFSVSSQSYALGLSGEVLHSVNPLLRPPISV